MIGINNEKTLNHVFQTSFFVFSQKICFFAFHFAVMIRIGVLCMLLLFACGKAFSGIGVELDVAFEDSTVHCRYLYVLAIGVDGQNDTIAIFDTLSFNGQNRISLFYTAPSSGKNMLSMVDSAGVTVQSKPFILSPRRTTFDVVVGKQQIKVINYDYHYLRKDGNESSFYVFLTIFFIIKTLITIIFVLVSKQRKRIITIASGAFLLCAFIDWLSPLNYLYRLLIIILTEYLMIKLIGFKYISWLRAALLVLIVNIVGYGIIAILNLTYVFW